MNRDILHLVDIVYYYKELKDLGLLKIYNVENNRANGYAFTQLVGIIHEAANNLSLEIKEECPFVDWKTLRGFRNRMAHSYRDIDLEHVWEVVNNHLPALIDWAEQRLIIFGEDVNLLMKEMGNYQSRKRG